MALIRRAILLAFVIMLATTTPTGAVATFTGVLFHIDGVTLVTTFTERGLVADTAARVDVTARS